MPVVDSSASPSPNISPAPCPPESGLPRTPVDRQYGSFVAAAVTHGRMKRSRRGGPWQGFTGPEREGARVTLIVVTIVAIASVIAALAIYLFMIGTLLGRTAGNLSACPQSVRSIAGRLRRLVLPSRGSIKPVANCWLPCRC
jgi:hypothetical protein